MPNDDLGQFPQPLGSAPTQPTPVAPTEPVLTDPVVPFMDTTAEEPPIVEDAKPSYTEVPTIEASHFDAPTTSIPEMPEETTPSAPPSSSDYVSPFTHTEPEPAAPAELTPELPAEPTPAIATPPQTPPVQMPATLPTASKSSPAPFVVGGLILVLVLAIAGATFLFQQTTSLRQQLQQVTQTIQSQQTNPSISTTPTVVIPPLIKLITPTSSVSANPTITPTPTNIVATESMNLVPAKPLSEAAQILAIGIKHQPNAQLILIKTENINNPTDTVTKYFFRQAVNVKKYFYILVTAGLQPEIVDRAITVTPDDNIPSLNGLVLQNTLGADLDEVLAIGLKECPDTMNCTNAVTRAQYILRTSPTWQLTYQIPTLAQPLIMQINAQTKEVVYKSPSFVNK